MELILPTFIQFLHTSHWQDNCCFAKQSSLADRHILQLFKKDKHLKINVNVKTSSENVS